MRELTLGGITYHIEEGSILNLPDPTRMYGEEITIYTDKFSVNCTNLNREGSMVTFRVNKIEDIINEGIIEQKPLKQLRKSELIEYANSLGIDVKSNMTKAQIIELIESHN